MSPACPQLVTRRRKGCKYWCKRCNLQFKGCKLGWRGCKFGAKGYKSEEKGIKVIIFCRKDDFPSLFREKLANFVCVFNYNKVQLIWIRMENRIKVVLADKKRTNKWLSEQLECAPTTVSKWCTNASQPPMETFVKIAELLEVDINELLRIEKKWPS